MEGFLVLLLVMKNGIVVEAKTRKYHLRYRDSLTWAARVNRKKETESEKLLWNRLLRSRKLGYKFTRQKPIDRFVVDFYCSELRLVVEVDGGYHKNRRGIDNSRDEFLGSFGIRTLRVSDADVMNNFEVVEKRIREVVGGLNPSFNLNPNPALSLDRAREK
jgi:very-short-patch-repair endonuclease